LCVLSRMVGVFLPLCFHGLRDCFAIHVATRQRKVESGVWVCSTCSNVHVSAHIFTERGLTLTLCRRRQPRRRHSLSSGFLWKRVHQKRMHVSAPHSVVQLRVTRSQRNSSIHHEDPLARRLHRERALTATSAHCASSQPTSHRGRSPVHGPRSQELAHGVEARLYRAIHREGSLARRLQTGLARDAARDEPHPRRARRHQPVREPHSPELAYDTEARLNSATHHEDSLARRLQG
jgi:hypothetical protein